MNAREVLRDLPEITEVDLDRELVKRGGLYTFMRLAWHVVEGDWAFIGGKHLELICAHLEAVSKGECTRLVINVPPGMSKSSAVAVFWPVWDWIRHGGRKQLYISFDLGISLRDAEKARRLLSSEWFQDRWGMRSPEPRGVAIMGTGGRRKDKATQAKSMYYTNQNGMRFSTMLQGKATGHHSDFQVIDDPVKPADIRAGGDKARHALQRVSDLWSNTFASRKRGAFSRVLIMQRLHVADLAAQCVKEGYTHLCLPMEYVPERHCKTPWGEDWRTEPGELLCPERIGVGDRASVETAKREMGARVAAAQLQQDPTPDGGAIFRREWFTKRWTAIPSGAVWWQSWDCAFKKTSDADFVVGQVWAKSGNDYYHVDQVRARMGFTATCQAIKNLTAKWPQAYRVLVEDKANGTAVMDHLNAEIPGLIPVEPRGGKEARANAVSTVWENGHVYYPEGAEWLGDLVEEFASFPLGANDDQVDCSTQAVSDQMPKEKDRYGMLARALAPPLPTHVVAPRADYVPRAGDVVFTDAAHAEEIAAQFKLKVVLAGGKSVVQAGPLVEVVRYAQAREPDRDQGEG